METAMSYRYFTLFPTSPEDLPELVVRTLASETPHPYRKPMLEVEVFSCGVPVCEFNVTFRDAVDGGDGLVYGSLMCGKSLNKVYAHLGDNPTPLINELVGTLTAHLNDVPDYSDYPPF